jgi:hypothetical protein
MEKGSLLMARRFLALGRSPDGVEPFLFVRKEGIIYGSQQSPE